MSRPLRYLLATQLVVLCALSCGESTTSDSAAPPAADAADTAGQDAELACTEPLDDGVECTFDYCADGEVRHDPLVGNPSWTQCATDVTFIAMGDPQYGGGADDKNTFQIAAMNSFPGTPWANGFPGSGEPVAEPLGVLIAGDLTQNGRDNRMEGILADEIGRFISDYGLTGDDGLLNYPVYEGYGNHDYDPDEPDDEDFDDWRWWYTDDPTPAVRAVVERNENRPGITNVAEGDGGHYSWDWGNLHLVQLNLFPGDEPSQADENSRVRDPRDALSFLVSDLETQIGDSGRPILLMWHYGLDQFGHEARWWTDEQKAAFLEAIEGYNVLGFMHGHTHATSHYQWAGYDVFNLGSPYYLEYNADGRGHFTLFRVTDSFMAVADVSWSPDAEGLDPAFGGWSHVVFFDGCAGVSTPCE